MKKKWSLTTPQTQKKVLQVLLTDGVWHPVWHSTFEVDAEEETATWLENAGWRRACPLSSICALTVTVVQP